MLRRLPWLGVCAWLMTGCASSLPDWAMPKRSFAYDISETSAKPQVRSQVGDSPLGPPKQMTPPASGGLLPGGPLTPPPPLGGGLLPPPPQFDKAPPILMPPPTDPNGIQTSLLPRANVRVRVCAWVNGKPIFDDEVRQAAMADFARLQRMSGPQRTEKELELFNSVLKQIVDQELMYQDAVKRLEKINPKTLEKMKDFVELEFDKSLKKMRDAKVPEDQIREIEPIARRMLERNLISQEYARSRIIDIVKNRCTIEAVREYYEAHKNEFRTLDKVEWQDIFIPTSPNLPKVEDVKRFAEEEIAKCRLPDDFKKLMVYNEGDSKLRGGEGMGQRLSYKDAKGASVSGDIQPSELEPYLAITRQGDIGPVVAFPHGVHLFRVTKREKAGQMPLDDQVQKQIMKKLENEIAEQEFQRIVRELRLRARIEIERETP